MYITEKPIIPSQFLNQPPVETCGASVSFAGTVRNHHQGRMVEKLYYECYESMANKQIQKIIEEVKQAFPIESIRVLHRIGELQIGETAVIIEVRSEHRSEAFDACRAMIDQIKSRVPIWKHEFYADGSNEWVLCQHAVKET